MLNFFRRRDTVARWVLGFFLVVICVAMVMFLIPQGSGSDSSTPLYSQTVATVEGTAITGGDLTAKLQQVGQGQQLPAQLLPMLGQQVLRNLITQQAVADQAQRMGFAPTTDEIVAAARQQVPQLYPDGKYVGDAMAAQIVAQGQMTLPQFQEQLRQSLMISKIYNLVTDPVRVSDLEVQKQFETDNEKATLDYALIKPADLVSQVQVTPAALDAYYKQHQAEYNSPERRKLEVALAATAQIAATIQVSDAAVHQYYMQNISQYTHPEQVKASHILIKYPDTTPTAAEIATTKQKAEDVLKQVQANPKGFADLAKKYSQDDASAPQGGELGFIQKNQTVANFEKAAFSLPVGQISGLVQTEYGFHIIKVEAHTPANVQSEASVHDEIVQQLQRDQALDREQNLMNRAAELAQTQPLAAVAKQLGLQYFATGALSKTDPITGIGIDPDFENAAFSTSAGALTAPVKVAQGFALAKVDTVIPPGPQALSAVLEQVTSDYKTAQSKTLAVERAKQLQQAAQKQGLKAAAASQHIAVKTAAGQMRSSSLPEGVAISSIAGTLYGLKPGQVAPVAPSGDNQLVYALVSLQQPSDTEFATQKAGITQTLIQQKRAAVFDAYTDALVAQLEKSGKVKIDQAAFQRVIGGQSGEQPSTPGAPAAPPPQPLGLGQ